MRVREALAQLDFARRYTRERLDTIPLEQWFTRPAGLPSHVAWQVGHIAMAEYRLCLERLRPRSAADEQLIPDTFLAAFARETVPGPADQYPPAAEIRRVFDQVHEQVLAELADYPDAELDRPVLKPHPLVHTRIESLRYAPLHEMIHCGQIALIRRMLGYRPVW